MAEEGSLHALCDDTSRSFPSPPALLLSPLCYPPMPPSLALHCRPPCLPPLSGSGTLAAGQLSDHLLLVSAFDAWHAAPNGREAARIAKQYCLDTVVLKQLQVWGGGGGGGHVGVGGAEGGGG